LIEKAACYSRFEYDAFVIFCASFEKTNVEFRKVRTLLQSHAAASHAWSAFSYVGFYPVLIVLVPQAKHTFASPSAVALSYVSM
jgi:hypothetical protein